jgi:hypothetical protein
VVLTLVAIRRPVISLQCPRKLPLSSRQARRCAAD